jgi:hypothetical protein
MSNKYKRITSTFKVLSVITWPLAITVLSDVQAASKSLSTKGANITFYDFPREKNQLTEFKAVSNAHNQLKSSLTQVHRIVRALESISGSDMVGICQMRTVKNKLSGQLKGVMVQCEGKASLKENLPGSEKRENKFTLGQACGTCCCSECPLQKLGKEKADL